MITGWGNLMVYRKLLAYILFEVCLVGLFGEGMYATFVFEADTVKLFVRHYEYYLDGGKGKYRSFNEAHREVTKYTNQWLESTNEDARYEALYTLQLLAKSPDGLKEDEAEWLWKLMEQVRGYFSPDDLGLIEAFLANN
jgi:hypothetical protein